MKGNRGFAIGLVASAVGALSGSCIGGGAPSLAPPPPAPEPFLAAETPVVREDLTSGILLPPDLAGLDDEILSSPMLRDPDFRAEVDRWANYWRTTAARWFPDYLERMGWFAQTVDEALREEGLPPSLRYLPVIESGYSPRAVSRASAVGLWQFMEPTAAGFGLEITPLLDERRDPFKSTAAAARFLSQLRSDFGSWFLALAAYNSGPARVERVLSRYAPLAPRSDSLYWALRARLPRETRDFVPKLFGAIIVAGSPESHGYERRENRGFDFDAVMIPDATTLDVVARAAETPEGEILRLNPEYVRGMTPPGRHVLVRVPAGSGRTFRLNYADIPRDERVTFVEHRVSRGETLSHIAARYGVPIRDLEAANPLVRPRFLRIGALITVPVAPSTRRGG
jgi:peptidoglycan lytic transglycosylase D